jgi:hypothetical protein
MHNVIKVTEPNGNYKLLRYQNYFTIMFIMLSLINVNKLIKY